MLPKILSYWRLHKIPLVLLVLSFAFYYTFAYHLDRTNFLKLISLSAALFYLCYKLIQFEKWNFKLLLAAGILFRVVFLFTEPMLSQDFYRFIWDGELLAQGINPYLYTPDYIMQEGKIIIENAAQLYGGMGEISAKNYSNYPPLNQLIFGLAALFSGKSMFGGILTMKLFILAADIGILYFGKKLLVKLNKSSHLIFWYFLNPLIIIELSGNLHFEGVMLFFFIWAMYLITEKKWRLSAPIFAFSIAVKLVPLLFLPLFLRHFGLKKTILFYVLVGATLVVIFLPFISKEFILNYSQTIGLWFSNFEFNSSFYNIVKKLAELNGSKNWETIKAFGKISPYITIGVVLIFSFLTKNKKITGLFTSMLWVLCIYYFISTTVHPWYVIFVVLLSVFTKFRFAIVWSSAVFLSYWAYANPNYTEHLGILSIEYISVFGFMIYEILRLKRQNSLFPKNMAAH
ncbi:mannosyltransferase [Cellulophaga sp. F20128]|uniref:mannosyltransferase n=1 Tax=Cellulophaga sp. F20128 TaxID=2926413 RepID=UPI001FF3DCD3|nr:mannosyltransferase [Cellulophaga sp. F20128]MCK0157379.1 mannosyltransferase [Cellulophaga sp. F20128]